MIGRGFGSIPHVVKNLLILNGIMFALLYFFEMNGSNLNSILGLYYWGSDLFEPYQIISHMFMHGNLMHIFFNMFALWMFGTALEQVWGGKRFLIFYIITGLGAALLHSLVIHFQVIGIENSLTPEQIEFVKATISNTETRDMGATAAMQDLYDYLVRPTVGASGAIYGILLGFAMLFPNTKLMLLFFPVPIKAKYFVLMLTALELFLGISQFRGDNIAHFAHLGGALFGFILIKIWQKSRNRFY